MRGSPGSVEAGVADFGNSPFPRPNQRRAGFSTGSPAGVIGSREAGFSFAGVARSRFFFRRGCGKRVFLSGGFRVFPSLSKKLCIAGSLHREGRRSPGSGIPPPGSPGFSIWERDLVFRNWPGKRVFLVRRFQSLGSGIPPPGSRGAAAGFSTGSPAGVPCRGAGFPRRARERDFRPGPPSGSLGSEGFRKRGFLRRPRRGHRGAGFATGCPAEVPRRGHWGSGIFLCRGCGKRVFLFRRFQSFLASLGPFTEKDDEARGAGFPRQGHRGAGFSTGSPAAVAGERNFPPPRVLGSGVFPRHPRRGSPICDRVPRRWGAEFSPVSVCLEVALQKPPRRERDSPAGVTGERDFRSGPALGLLGSGIFPRRGRGKRVFLSRTGSRSSEIPPRHERDSPGRGHRGAGFSTGPIARVAGERNFLSESRSSEIPPCREHDSPAGPRQGHRGAGFSTGSPAGVAGERNFPSPGSREAGFSLSGSLFKNSPSP